MKISFISLSALTVYLIFVKFNSTYLHTSDTFRIEILIVPSILLAVAMNYQLPFLEVSVCYLLFIYFFATYIASIAK